eukprot:TRINITY_DN10038_c0_g1_i1.p1 TRINITY_DN10038_c0_g1~~TRINITY_DN10038_c0_g1_i1.p1  ORF type:complete len:538 (+),score=98.39 TRINITY_DN10038_c0_g1_i1:86-1699(+)
MKESGSSRSWTTKFKSKRLKHNHTRKTERDYVHKSIQTLKKSTKETGNVVSPRGIQLLTQNSLFVNFEDRNGKAIALDTIPICKVCSTSFNFKLKLQCPSCKYIVCSDCKKANPICPVEICKRCVLLVKKQHDIDNFKKVLENAKENPMVLCHNTLMSIKSEINNKMSAINSLLQSLLKLHSGNNSALLNSETLGYIEKQATEQLKILELNFKNYQNRLKRISSLANSCPREEIIKKHLRLACVQFLEFNFPRFNMVSNQLVDILRSDELKLMIHNESMKKLAEELNEEKLVEQHKQALEQTKLENEKKSAAHPNPPPPTDNVQRSSSRVLMEKIWEKSKDISQNIPKTIPKNLLFYPFTYGGGGPVQDDKPAILKIKPTLVPMRGGLYISIQGQNFKPGFSIIVGGARIPNEEVKIVSEGERPSEIAVKVPQMYGPPGTKPIILINPDNQTSILENVLTYVEDDTYDQLFAEVVFRVPMSTTKNEPSVVREDAKPTEEIATVSPNQLDPTQNKDIEQIQPINTPPTPQEHNEPDTQ